VSLFQCDCLIEKPVERKEIRFGIKIYTKYCRKNLISIRKYRT